MISVFYRVERIVGKGENAGYQYFLLFPVFSKCILSQGHKRSELYGKELALSDSLQVLTPARSLRV